MSAFFSRMCFLVAVIVGIAGCANRSKATAPAIPELGKVHVYYVFTAADEADPVKAFNVYRSEKATGPFAKANPAPIAPPSAPAVGRQSLLITDYGLKYGSEYFYYVEKVDTTGRARKVTPVTRAQVVLPLLPEDRAAAEQAARREHEAAREGRKG